MSRIRLLVLPAALLLTLFALPQRPGEAGKLAEDGRAGMVLEVQGTALVQPAGRERWTPLGAKSVLYPGDLVRTSARGAHALEVATGGGKALLGPGSELQVQGSGQLRLLRGELEVDGGGDDTVVSVTGPGDFGLKVKGTAWLRTQEKKTVALEKAPRWVEGYRASASDEWMGSLLAKVDGRDVPLAVGYHKVNVEVRDQIARTTVEQSFVNSTTSRLEGVFYFPLPADASISGFGMWIGGELVEADIVERQRARQIYEDILRRKKDPGLLEWEGGNIFKARVFPIEAHSEKRIRIRYTQVLPLEGDTWRYRYALRSELLRSKPLRELSIQVSVVSTQPMRAVGSPTHEIVLHSTGHEATAEFRASEYSPKDDFELAVQVERAGDVTVVPHRRGDDGYFMLLVAPPDEASGTWKRDLVPEGKPLNVVFVADTSGSMDDAARANQAAFLAAMLELLGAGDRFELLACDATTEWLTPEPQPPAGADAALAALARRRSLGWTDLDLALETALGRAPEGALVIYVGDGVGTTGNADPVEQAERIRALGQGAKVSVHAVAASTSYEAGVLAAMARIGGGAVRTLASNPARDAADLLAEAARPTVREMRVSIEGLRTARVYPAELPNLPLGSQQVVLGRFLPTGQPQTGKVVVTGTLDGKPVRYTADLAIGAGDAGNSFLPRLWGRRHIDALLASGSSQETQDEIVGFSERFGIMTPYTSFLVLESDEDRELYGVERRVQMRDGERFFADAKDRAALEKKRDLMREAGRWRLGLRRTMLQEIARLGRDLPIYDPPHPPRGIEVAYAPVDSNGPSGGVDKLGLVTLEHGVDRGISLGRELAEAAAAAPADGSDWGGAAGDDGDGAVERLRTRTSAAAPQSRAAPSEAMPPPAASPAPARKARARRELASKEEEAGESPPEASNADMDDLEEMEREDDAMSDARAKRPADGYFGGLRGGGAGRGGGRANEDLGKRLAYTGRRWQPTGFTLQSLGFPAVPQPPEEPGEGTESPWSEEVLAVLRGLPRRDAVRAIEGGFHILTTDRSLHPTRGSTESESRVEAWIGAKGWRVLQGDAGFGEPSEQWVQDGVRGALANARRLARTREAKEQDGNAWWLPLWDLASRDVLKDWRRAGWRASLVPTSEGGIAMVRLHRDGPDKSAILLTIDTDRQMVIETRWLDRTGRTSGRVARADPIEVGGRWWAQDIRQFDREDRLTALRTVKVEVLSAGALEKLAAQATERMQDVLAVHGELPKAHAAKQALHERRAAFVDQLVLAVTLGQQQRWDPSLDAWAAAEKLAGGKPGTRWIRTEFTARARRGEAFKTWLAGLVPFVEKQPGLNARFLAYYLYGHASSVFGPTERLALLDTLAKAWTADDRSGLARLLWELRRSADLDAAQRYREARALRAKLAADWPFRTELLLAYENDLWTTGRFDEATGFLDKVLAEREPWLDQERDGLYARLTDRLWERRELKRLHATFERWLTREPEQPYVWQRWYSTFYFLGEGTKGDDAVRAALALRPADGTAESLWARQAGAVQLALGDGWDFSLQNLEASWLPDLEALALYLIRLDTDHPTAAWQIYANWRFRQNEAYRRIRAAMVADLAQEQAVERMPLARLGRYIGWLDWGPNDSDEAVYQDVLGRLRKRWGASDDPGERASVGDHLLALLDARSLSEDGIVFARERLAYATERKATDRARRAQQLFDRLLNTPERDERATTEREDECFALLAARLDPEASEDARRAEMARSVRRLAERIYRWRFEAGLGTPEERKDLTRAALQELRREVRQKVRLEVAQRFAQAQAGAPALAMPWFALERLSYAVEYGEGLEAIIEQAAKRLTESNERKDAPLDRLYRERLAVILAYAATRKNVPDDRVAFVLDLFTRGDAAEQKAHEADADTIELLDWRYQTYRLLVARDDTPALEVVLDDWIVPAKVDSRWRIARGYVHAETGDLAAAVSQFEEVEKLDELGAADYRVMADWYLVLGDDARRIQALARYYDHQNEWQLSNLAWQYGNTRRNAGVPGDFDPQTLPVLRALFRKARWPGNYWWRQRDLYNATKDFRILACCGDALTGHTKEAVYAYLSQFTNLMNGVHEEATLDELEKRLGAMLASSDQALDRRALRLATSLAAGRASRVKVQDPSHAVRALAALREAFQEQWQDGERRLMAEFLRGLGKVEDAAVRAEQMRQLEALRVAVPADSEDRLVISDALAQALWVYADHDRALAVLEAALADAREANEGRVPMDSVRIFDRYVNWLSNRGRFADAERYVLTELERWDLPMRRRGLRGLLYSQYVETLRRGGSVSIGRGGALYTKASELMEATMLEEPAFAGNVLSTYGDLHLRAKETRSPADAGQRLVRYARERMPALLERVPINGTNYVTNVASRIKDLEGPRTALGFLLDRVDAEPRWLDRIGYDVWHQAAWNFARWRQEAGAIGDLEPRLLKLVLAQLEANLTVGGNHASVFWSLNNKWSWREKAADFASTAEKVAELNEGSLAVIQRCANVLRGNLNQHRAGVALLLAAHGRGLLDLNTRWTLASWLVADRRFDEALPLAEALVAERPDHLGFRLRLVEALAGLRRTDAVAALLDATETHFREAKKWSEGVAAQLGEVAAAQGMPARAERWLEEAIRMRQEATGHRGGRDSTLSRYYRSLAKARSALGKTVEAVQAASTAILSANVRNPRELGEALKSLDDALASTDALDAYAETYEAEVTKSGLDAPVLRKALARAYSKRKDPRSAVRQLLAARDLEPGDAEVHAALVAAYDELGDAAGAIDALFGSIRLAPQALDAYRSLADRYAKAGDESDAERARTTLVEASPHQAAGHAALAAIREEQERWPEAVVQWQQAVRTERLDPTGWLALARVLLRTGQADEARQAIEHVLTTSWESRFGDVKAQATELLRRLKQ